jgi:hypothetical protein
MRGRIGWWILHVAAIAFVLFLGHAVRFSRRSQPARRA